MLETRPVRPDEHHAVADLVAVTYLDEGWADTSYEPVMRDVADRAAHATVLVALLDDRLVGTVTVALGGPYAEHAGPGEAVIRMLCTYPDARGHGAGRALVAAGLALAREADCTAVRLSTQAPMDAARAVYEGFGFVRDATHDWEPVPGLQLLGYVLPLTEAPWCGHCGVAGVQHDSPLDPPRYCTRCRRRMVVQVHPTGWSARCVEHGTVTG